ncbi:uncharacterized protein LOC130222313 isoform X2 [Danio aesculapii]|uniref:uncharacterized protein LOC130222313 isoform X2 n=1 Tax=Danio aesculapii TaxID=1142201 RepID=UPI0024BF3CAA|nr:uncharacterized protein LOC130222313 isoform X2 [Danio aesculapii]
MSGTVSDLRIVLLGNSVSETSSVGNFILGREAFDTEASSDEQQYCERVRGKKVTVINTPLLLNPDLPLRHFSQGVRECVSLSAPGPHVIVLVLKHEYSQEEKECAETVLNFFSDRVFEHTIVLTTQEPERVELNEVNDVMKEIIDKCFNRHYRWGKNSSSADLIATFQEIVQKNGGHPLTCKKVNEDSAPEKVQLGKGQSYTAESAEMASNEQSRKSRGKKHEANGNGEALSVVNVIKNKWSNKIEYGSNENLPIYKLYLEDIWQNRDGFCKRSRFGKNITKENKTIMMIGATGAGKTTLINSMINYILGVKWEDDVRFVLIDEGQQKSQAESQTSEITAYKINHMDGFRVPYSLTIVDTPGFGDTRGIKQDQKITAQIQEFFSARGGIDCIDAVCFVVQASLARLTHTQKYVFDSILSIFGKDIAENILMMVTFADGKKPPVLEAIIKSEIPCSTDKSGEPIHFKLNNSAVFANINKPADDEDSDCENFDQMFWKMGFSSMKKFFTCLINMETKSLTLTREVLKERKHLEFLVEGLEPQIKAGLTKLDEIRKTRAALEQNKAEMDANKDFEYELEVTVPKQIENTTNYFLTNCQKCHYTCHDTCAISNDSAKHGCIAMKDGKCTVCPGKCAWNVHFNQKYKWDYIKETRKETYQDLKKRFEEAHGEVMTKEKIFEKLEYELEVVQDIVTGLIKDSQKSLECLEEIALKPNPLSTPDYIDLMIESEKQEAKPGFLDRIQSLNEVKVKAEIISKVSTGGAVPEDLKTYKPETSRNKPYDSNYLFRMARKYYDKVFK